MNVKKQKQNLNKTILNYYYYISSGSFSFSKDQTLKNKLFFFFSPSATDRTLSPDLGQGEFSVGKINEIFQIHLLYHYLQFLSIIMVSNLLKVVFIFFPLDLGAKWSQRVTEREFFFFFFFKCAGLVINVQKYFSQNTSALIINMCSFGKISHYFKNKWINRSVCISTHHLQGE